MAGLQIHHEIIKAVIQKEGKEKSKVPIIGIDGFRPYTINTSPTPLFFNLSKSEEIYQ